MEQTFRSVVYGRIIISLLFILIFVGSAISQPPKAKTYTPQGTEVTLYVYSESYTSAEKAAKKAYCTQTYPRAIYMGEATTIYNCHAYAWSVSEGGEKYWMNSPNDDLYWTDGSYVQTNQSDPKATKVSYASDDHSAVVSSSGYFTSKWGALCLMSHFPGDCPYNSSNLKYYKLNMEISGDKVVELAATNSVVTRQYTLSNVPSGAVVEWTVLGRGTIIDGQGSDMIQVSISGAGTTVVSAKVNCPTGLVVKIPFSVNVISSSGPIITDIELMQYGPTYILRAVTNKPEGNFVWSVSDDNAALSENNATLYDNPYPDDAWFCITPNVFKAIRVNVTGYYNVTVMGSIAGTPDIHTFSKRLYIQKSTEP